MWSLQDAKARFSAVVDAAMAGEPQEVTRRGKPAVVVVSVEEWRRLSEASQTRTEAEAFKEHLLSIPWREDVPDPFPRIDAQARPVEF
ncbi:type II toxin-antitoxin system Phd/YefM family antitoxin [Jannaschia sp. LMIT008]|uniref:type II toxin-antitoxin system Phd/YefM family antitoxin n=1 Tax=Jannaschia maritima TaxID=3032585 RepID=UPI00281224FE|nr:type II toxin-antitoxin system Phd/YefM family antitoxin [Jannaschia sp. LMIT008]